MHCAQCGEQIPAGARFCGSCGARVDAPEAPEAAPEAAAAAPEEPARAAGDLAGQTVAGRYKLLRRVAEGGMGSVYVAEQALGGSRRSVAVKLLRPELSHDPSIKARFEREAATVARLEHFNTVRIYDFGTAEDGTLFLVMEYIEGRSLQSVLDETGPLPPERVARIASQVAASLDEAHRLGIVHRDLKPDNILLIESYASERDVVKLVDFGIAKGQPSSGGNATTKLTELGTFVGTPAYMSPEQFSGAAVSPRSDIYSLGVTTHQMLAGKLPFHADSIIEWAQAHLSASPPPLGSDHGAGPIPEHMQRAVLRALSKEPEARQVSAAQFSNELSGRGGTDQTQAASDAPPPVVIADAPVGPLGAAPGPMKTAPMTRLPDVAAARGPAPTQPMAAVPALSPARAAGIPLAPTLSPSGRGRARRGRGWLWALLAVLVAGGTALALTALRVTPWQLAMRAEPEPPPLIPPPEQSAPEQSAPPEPAPPEPEPEPAPPPETPRAPAPRPSAPATPPPATTPPPAPPIQLPPGTPSPAPTTPAPTTPAPSQPGQTPAIPGLPQLPWSLPTAGACERCAAALRGSGNYIIVNAVAESVLCEDRAAREACERQIEELAPGVAERAARGGDCPAALATAAAALNVRVSPDKFAIVNSLCLR